MSNCKIDKCRLCKSKILKKIFDFGRVSLGNNLQTKISESLISKEYPLSLNRCNECCHFQLSYSVDPKILYAKNYTYLSNTGSSFVEYLKKNSQTLIKKLSLKKKDFILDIGSNDGTALKFYQKKGIRVCGVDPALLPSREANKKKIFTYHNFFTKKVVRKIIKKFGKADLIISHNTLAHVHNIHSIFKNIFFSIKHGGYFVFEVGYFKNVVEKNYFDTIYHEHLDYHHANPLCNFLKEIGFSIYEITTNNMQGGSLKILCKKEKKIYITRQASKFLKNEKKSILYDENFFKKWDKIVKAKAKEINFFVKKNKNKSIYGYGAPTKCVLLLKLSHLKNNEIRGIFEDNQLKVSKFLPKSKIRVFSSDLLPSIKIDYLIIFAWNFANDIIKKLRKKNIKTKVVLPLPKLKIIKL